ncbi:MAG: TIGR01212 family radical SAM protein [Deltaproteobacteria bacterium]|nr:TIGR01212 family radical SAM protein [Deltaproteobacteria bacterium]
MTGKQLLYLTFNAFLKERFGERVQKITLDAGLTCPNRDGTRGRGGCTYCDASGSGTGAASQIPDVRSQALSGMQAMQHRYNAQKFIAYFQSFCNTYAPAQHLNALYDSVADLPGVVGLSVATRPDCLNPEILDLLAGYSKRLMVTLELGLQSCHDVTLARINRGHTFKEFLDGFALARRYPLRVCVHIIIGLPGETAEHVNETARELARLKPDGVKIHCLYIHKGTALEQEYIQGNFQPILQEEFVASVCDALEMLPPSTVIERLTGDPLKKLLVAPEWTLRKQDILSAIEQELLRRDSRQGQYWKE